MAIIASVAMLGAVAAGMCVVGSPTHQRQLKLDDQRISALSVMANAVHRYRLVHHTLPGDLSELRLQGRWSSDPVTGEPYAYNRLGDDTYTLCAHFDAVDQRHTGDYATPYLYTPGSPAWRHPAGLYCFHFAAESDNVPVLGTPR
ncbi:hypothetical protein [Dyella monticola]|nr:hypothetical protein [Dyella monticola]